MGIVTSKEIYERCLNENWAVGGFIGYDMEIMQAAAEAAIKEKAPIMIRPPAELLIMREWNFCGEWRML